MPALRTLVDPEPSAVLAGPVTVAGSARTEGPEDPHLHLAEQLATAGSLTLQVDTTLPVLAGLCGASVAVFAVAGSRAAGVRC